MYNPINDGIENTGRTSVYTEARPPSALSNVVHCYWQLKTDTILSDDFFLHVLPDACVNILFNQLDTDIAGITALHTTFEVLNLGKEFHYVGIQFLPGVWQGDRKEITGEYVGTAYTGSLPLIDISERIEPLDFTAKHAELTKLVEQLISEEIVVANPLTESILSNLDEIHSVGDMAALTHLSPRQLQRTLKKLTGFSPHDLLKVLRLQHSFKHGYLDAYADQSHFIHSFKKITGYTPEQYAQKFGV